MSSYMAIYMNSPQETSSCHGLSVLDSVFFSRSFYGLKLAPWGLFRSASTPFLKLDFVIETMTTLFLSDITLVLSPFSLFMLMIFLLMTVIQIGLMMFSLFELLVVKIAIRKID